MSERSSVISINDGLGLIDSDTDVDTDHSMFDVHKYRMPSRHSSRHTSSSGPTITPTECEPATPSVSTTTAMATAAGAESDTDFDADVDFTNYLSRRGSTSSRFSIYTLSRVSFASQLAQLNSIQLPDATSLSARISCMPTSSAAASALKDSADQIRRWIKNALVVLDGLDAEDDVEWAAAGGKQGLDHVDRAIGRFDKVVKLYILSVEELHIRPDITALPKAEVQSSSDDMDAVLKEWQKIKESLAGVKEQVEIAMEWEELSESVGTGIAHELDELAGLVFEMEEQRHRSVISSSIAENVDIDELKTIVDDNPSATKRTNRMSLPAPFSPTSSLQPSSAMGNMEDNLLGLFARMQPLRASLDFLPMRLSVFHCRGNSLFPTACLNLEGKRDSLEAQWKKLEADAEALRRELGEDRWLLVFRNAGKQALKMCQSVSRSVEKLRSAIDDGEQHTDSASVTKKLENYEAKKNHYGSAIERVLAIIDRGVLDRLTVNGEILGLQSDMKRKWSGIQLEMRELDSRLHDLNLDLKSQQLRDSISTIVSSEHSLASSFMDTPRSSSASSVSRPSSNFNDNLTPGRSRGARFVSAIPRKTPQSKSRDTTKFSPYMPYTPPPATDPLLRQFKAPADKPRWNNITSTRSTSFNTLPQAQPISDPSSRRRVTVPQRAATPHSSVPRRSVTPHSSVPQPSLTPRSTVPQRSVTPQFSSRIPAPRIPAPTSPTTPSKRQMSAPLTSPVATRSQSSMAYRSSSGGLRPRASCSSLIGTPQQRAPSSLRKTSYLSPTLTNMDEDDDQGEYGTGHHSSIPRRMPRSSSAMSMSGGSRKPSLFGFRQESRQGNRLF